MNSIPQHTLLTKFKSRMMTMVAMMMVTVLVAKQMTFEFRGFEALRASTRHPLKGTLVLMMKKKIIAWSDENQPHCWRR